MTDAFVCFTQFPLVLWAWPILPSSSYKWKHWSIERLSSLARSRPPSLFLAELRNRHKSIRLHNLCTFVSLMRSYSVTSTFLNSILSCVSWFCKCYSLYMLPSISSTSYLKSKFFKRFSCSHLVFTMLGRKCFNSHFTIMKIKMQRF